MAQGSDPQPPPIALVYARAVSPNTSGLSAPVADQDRIVAMDVIRGVAIGGILLVNIHFFAFTFFDAYALSLGDRGRLNDACRLFVAFFAQGKFITIFSILFGAGLALQYQRAQQARRPFTGMYARRLAFLLMFGLMHGLLVWYGDILMHYAMVGFVALLFCRARARTLMVVSVLSFLVPLLGITGWAVSHPDANYSQQNWSELLSAGRETRGQAGTTTSSAPADETGATSRAAGTVTQDAGATTRAAGAATRDTHATTRGAVVTSRDTADTMRDARPTPRGAATTRDAVTTSQTTAGATGKATAAPDQARPGDFGTASLLSFLDDEQRIYRSGTWGEAFKHRAFVFLSVNTMFAVVVLSWRTLAMFLLGMAMIKSGYLSTRLGRRSTYRRWLVIGLAIGLPLQVWSVGLLISAEGTADHMIRKTWADGIGTLMLAVAYINGLILLCRRPAMGALLRPVAAMGRMALSNYLCHSFICTFVFYGFGLGLFGQASEMQVLLLVLAILGAQLVISPLWLRRYRFGPFEWLWRSLTYWRVQPFRRTDAA